jgi:hypothetical protein
VIDARLGQIETGGESRLPGSYYHNVNLPHAAILPESLVVPRPHKSENAKESVKTHMRAGRIFDAPVVALPAIGFGTFVRHV